MAKDFKGHFESADPRNVLWGAGGCVWPTVPPFRIRLGSENAPIEWELFKTSGTLFEAFGTPTHDDVTWQSISATPPDVTSAWIWRHYERADDDIRWTLFFNTPLTPQPWEITLLTAAPVRGNRTVAIADFDWTYGYPSPGNPLLLTQVYFNESLPPSGWPPWA